MKAGRDMYVGLRQSGRENDGDKVARQLGSGERIDRQGLTRTQRQLRRLRVHHARRISIERSCPRRFIDENILELAAHICDRVHELRCWSIGRKKRGDCTFDDRSRRIAPFAVTREIMVQLDPTPELRIEQITFVQEQDNHDLHHSEHSKRMSLFA